MDNEQLNRYSRHILLPEMGVEGQVKLLAAKVLLVGAGGLGCPAALYLAAAGVGRIGIDFDKVDASNLQRQVLYTTADIGKYKVDVAKERIQALNPDVQVDCIRERLDSDNALELFSQYDLVVDGTDNFATRYLVNDACVLTGTPNIYGSIFRFEGQMTIYAHPEGPCYRCLFPEPPSLGRCRIVRKVGCWSPAWNGWCCPGYRSDQADSWSGSTSFEPNAYLRCPRDEMEGT